MTQISSLRRRGFSAGNRSSSSSSSSGSLRRLILLVLGCLIGINRLMSPSDSIMNVDVNINEPATTTTTTTTTAAAVFLPQKEEEEIVQGIKPILIQRPPPPKHEVLATLREAIEKPITEPTDSQAITQDSAEDEGAEEEDDSDEDESTTEPPEAPPVEPPTAEDEGVEDEDNEESTKEPPSESPPAEPPAAEDEAVEDDEGAEHEEEDSDDEESTEAPPEADSSTSTTIPQADASTNSISQETPPNRSSSCQRQCPKKRINRIFFHNKPAGLLDRELTYHVMSNLAGYLCALVEIPPPKVSLQAIHNHGLQVDAELRWNDFFNMTFVQDGSPSLLEAIDNPKFPEDFRYWGTSGTYKQEDYPGWKIVVTAKKDNMTNHYMELQEFSFQQSPDDETGFIWEIHKPYFKSELRRSPSTTLPALPAALQATLGSAYYSPSMHPFLKWSPSNVTGCNYVNDDQYQLSPTQLEPIREAIRNKVRSLAPSNTDVFGFFHIRRGDGMKQCNTSLPVLRDFFDCSVAGTEQTGKHITFLLASDEHDEEYRQTVMKDFVKDLPHISMLDADEIVDSMMKEMAESGEMPKKYLNNYHQFEFLKTLGMDRKFNFSSVHLIRRRNVDCQECTNLLTTYPEAWL